MRRRLPIILLLSAWLLATGSQWDVVQVFAWARMTVGYARTMPLDEALRETFDPHKPCKLCCAVKEAKAREQSMPLPPETLAREKLLLVFQSVPAVLISLPKSERWTCVTTTMSDQNRAAPPVPPPRAAA